MEYELLHNTWFHAGSWVLMQLDGVPIGGPISAQAASLYMAVKELQHNVTALYNHHFISA